MVDFEQYARNTSNMPSIPNPASNPTERPFDVVKKTKDVRVGPVSITTTEDPRETPKEVAAKETAKIRPAIKLAVDKDAALRANKLKELSKLVDFFEEKLNQIPAGNNNPINRLVVGATDDVLGRTQAGKMGAKIAAYQSDIKGLRVMIARGLGDVGRIPLQELQSDVNILPTVWDSKETRALKIANFREIMIRRGIQGGAHSALEAAGSTQMRTAKDKMGNMLRSPDNWGTKEISKDGGKSWQPYQ